MHKDDRMTPVERLNGFLTGGEMDRLLAMPLICSMSGKCAGMTHKEKRSSAENEAKCQIAAYERFGNDLLITEYGSPGWKRGSCRCDDTGISRGCRSGCKTLHQGRSRCSARIHSVHWVRP